MTKANKNKSDQLGMNYSTAYHQLKKQVLFMMVQKSGMDKCYRCNEKIETHKELTIEHKVEWQGRDNSYFWDLDNIAFSHAECNRPRNYTGRPISRLMPKDMAWCPDCRQLKPISGFLLRVNGKPRSHCKVCDNIRKRKARKRKRDATRTNKNNK